MDLNNRVENNRTFGSVAEWLKVRSPESYVQLKAKAERKQAAHKKLLPSYTVEQR
tara:strand:+ start:10036 stop:10200 length:165 start_codon:yes stop_codon:yes gene_type:complete